jgi:hypothetical protein
MLKMGSHRNPALAADWKNLGPEAFRFEVLEALKPLDEPGYDPGEDLEILEGIWTEKLQPFGDKGYNGPKPQAPG